MTSQKSGSTSSSKDATSPYKKTAVDEDIDAIQRLSLEEVKVTTSSEAAHGSNGHFSRHSRGSSKKAKDLEAEAGGCLRGLKRNKNSGKAPVLPPVGVSGMAGTAPILVPQGADANIVRSGHYELDTLYASNDVVTGPITVNVCNAPNNSTLQCGCENINCPFCNLMLSIEKTDPSVLQ